MHISLHILASPESPGAETAWQFAQACLRAGHRIERVFFQADGVRHASAGSRWLDFAHAHTVDLVICSTAALEQGWVRPQDTSLHGFAIAGLAQLVDAIARSDRLVSFGA